MQLNHSSGSSSMTRIQVAKGSRDQTIKLSWYNDNDVLHRTDGPALIWVDGDKWYYLDGMYLSENTHKREVTQWLE